MNVVLALVAYDFLLLSAVSVALTAVYLSSVASHE